MWAAYDSLKTIYRLFGGTWRKRANCSSGSRANGSLYALSDHGDYPPAARPERSL